VPIDTVVALGEAARRRHPADYHLCALVAGRLAREMRPESLRWLNEAMYLNPTHPTPHLMAAELLAATGRKSQALVEYRLAAAGAPEPRALVWSRVLAHYPALDDLLAATPDDADRLALLAKWLHGLNRVADAERVYELLLSRDPRHVHALTGLARAAIQRRDPPSAARRVRALLDVDQGPQSRRLAIEERILAGDLAGAEARADRWPDTTSAGFEIELALSDALARAGRTEEARLRLDRISRWGLARESRIRLHEARAALEHASGNEHQSRWELEQRDLLRDH
jgi:hypothetical protein